MFEVGDVFYKSGERITKLPRNKVHMEHEGHDWFRYETSVRVHEVVTFEVLGVLTKKLEGEWENGAECELLTEYFIRTTCSHGSSTFTTDLRDEGILLTFAEADILSRLRNEEEKQKDFT